MLTLLLMIQLQHKSTLFPYTTLFRSDSSVGASSIATRRTAGRACGRTRRAPRPRTSRTSTRRDTSRRCVEVRSEEHTSELQSHSDLVCRLLLEKKNIYIYIQSYTDIT